MLAVAVKRRIAMFHLDGSDLVALREFTLTDIPAQIAWCGAYVCIATAKNEYVCLGVLTVTCTPKHGRPDSYCLLNANGGAVTELFSAGRVTPCMLPLPNEQGLLLTRDAVAVFLGALTFHADQPTTTSARTQCALQPTPHDVLPHATYVDFTLTAH